MQACVYEEYGAPEVVTVRGVVKPTAKDDEVLVRVGAASVTTADWRFRASAFPRAFWLAGRLMVGLFRPRNAILGMDFAGVVEATGKNVTRFRVGDRVFGATDAFSRGAHAEYVAVKESGVILHTPDRLSDQQAAAVPFGANSALAFLRDVARVQPGQRVLVVGASGGVGTWAVQLARHFGAQVTGVCSARNVELVRSLGAHDVIDYGTGALTREGETYDVIVDTVGVTTFDGIAHALSDNGLYVPIESGVREMAQALFTSLRAGKKVKYAVSKNTREGLELVAGLIAAGTLEPVIDQVYPMAQIAEAHRRVEGRHKRGSVIVSMDAAFA